MKKTFKLFSILALLLCVVSCQISNVDNGVLGDNGLKVTAVIDNGTRLAYDVDNTAYTITPTWAVGDQIIGVDDKDQKFTFTVESVNEGVATLNVGSYVYGEAHELKAFYAPGVNQSEIKIDSLTVSLDPQEGKLDAQTPVVMSAVSEIVNGAISLTFTKQTAIVGLKKFKLPKQATITSMELNGVSTGVIFAWDYQGMRVTSSNEIGSIHLKGNWETDAEGVCTTPVYFAVAPQKNAKLSLSMSTGSEHFYNVNTIDLSTIEAGYYYHMTKEMGGPAVTVNGEGYASLEEAFTAASALPGPVTITLLKDVAPTGLCNFYNPDNTSTNILDLNGHNITTATTSLINVKDCNLTLTDGTTDDPTKWGTITTAKAGSSTAYVVIISGTASFTMLRGNIYSTVSRCLNLTAGPTATLKGGKIESTVGIAVGIGSSGGTLYITGDIKIIGSGNVVYLWGGTANFTGGYVSNAKTSAPIYAAEGAKIIFAGGYVKTTNINTVASASAGEAYVTGGYHSVAVRDVYAKDDRGSVYYNELNTDEATQADYPYHVVSAATNPLVATVLSGSNVWNHSNIQSAGMQADIRSKNTAATTLKIQSDITAVNCFSFEEPHKYLITVDLNSHKLTSGALPALQAHCPMVLMDTGGAGEIYTTGAIAVRSSADLTINGGSYYAGTNAGSTAIVATDTCKLVINDGYFYGFDSYDVRKTSENASITISGGRFRKALDASTLAEGCEAKAEEYTHHDRTYSYKVAAATVVATVNGTGYASLESAIVAVNALSAEAGRALLVLQADVENATAINITNKNLPVAIDLNGHVISSTIASLFKTSGEVNIMDSSVEKTGKITSTESKVIHMTDNGAQLVINGCTIESTKATGSAWNKDAVVYLESDKTTQVYLNNAKIVATKKLTTVVNYYSTLSVSDTEISSGTESEGWYAFITVCGATTVYSGSVWTSGTGNSSTCHIADSAGSIIVNGGYFWSNGRAISGGNASYYGNLTLNSCYSNKVPSTPSSGTGAPTYGEGKSCQAISPAATHLHATTGATLEYGYQVK